MQQRTKAKRQRKPRRQEGDHNLREGQRVPVGEYEVTVVRAGSEGGAVKLRVRKVKAGSEK